MYLIYSTRHQGFATTTGQYHSDWKEAACFSITEALAKVKRHRESGFTSFPVNEEHLK